MGRTGFAGLRLNITQLPRHSAEISHSVPKLVMGLIGNKFFSSPGYRIVFLKLHLVGLFLCVDFLHMNYGCHCQESLQRRCGNLKF